MRCRKNVKRLSVGEKRRFILAIQSLKAQNSVLHPGMQGRFDDYAEIHLNAMMAVPNWGHLDSAFFPWHRELLYHFEQELRVFDPTVTVPYWDWTREQAAAAAGFPFTHDFIGVDGDPADHNRVKRDPAFATTSPYHYPFDPNAWTIKVKDGGEPDFLTRHFHSRADAPNLPANDAIVVGVNSTYRQAVGTATYLDLRARSESLHNLVHRWVNGNMLLMSSPNDPVFFMHHAAIDRMWTIWKQKHPAAVPYQNISGAVGHGLNDTLIFHNPADPAPWTGTATPNQLVDSHAVHGESIWYESDLPEITIAGGLTTLDFGDIPQGLTTYRAVHFRINTFRQVRFRITAAPTGNFGLTPLGTEFIVEPTFGSDPVDGFVWVQFHATGGTSQSSSVTVEAYLIDEDGYYAATEGGEVILGNFTVSITAGVTPRADNSAVLVLDRSGSMSSPAGGSSTRSSLLKSAVGVFHALLLPSDEIGIVSFDNLVETPLPLSPQSAGLGTVLTGSSLDPRGSTAIGLGIQAGSGLLAGASHTNRALLVLTDGNQNVHPYVEELPSGTITSRVYAIGFGLPGEVSDMVLSHITQNTHGDLIITGNLASDSERFLLTKYFVQVLANVTSANVILDPHGELAWGAEQRIPFIVAETDISLDLISLCPMPPFLLFELETPSGRVITPGVAAAEPNIEFVQREDVAFYRLELPALPADAAGSHAGTWTAVLRLRDPGEIRKWLDEHRTSMESVLSVLKRQTLPYSFVAHTRSNLDFKAALHQDLLKPGATLRITALLSEYGVPHVGSASVQADLVRPDGSGTTITLKWTEPGRYETEILAIAAGIYRFRVRATGRTTNGGSFTREKTLSASLFAGEPRPNANEVPWGGGDAKRAPEPESWVQDLARRTLAADPRALFREAAAPVPLPKPQLRDAAARARQRLDIPVIKANRSIYGLRDDKLEGPDGEPGLPDQEDK